MTANIKNTLSTAGSFVTSLEQPVLYDGSLVVKIQNLYEHYIQSPVRNFIRPFYFPLFSQPSLQQAAQLKKEEEFFANFWDPKAPLYPELSRHEEIKANFTCRNEDFSIVVKGQSFKMQCCIIESRNATSKNECCNLVHALGSMSTVNNTIMHTYPLLVSYLDSEKEKPPIRFILLTQYATTAEDGSSYQPETIMESGLILSEGLKAIEEAYGTIDQLLAHSLGSIVTAAGLRFFHKEFPEDNIPLSFLATLWNQIATFFNQVYNDLIAPLTGRVIHIQTYDEPILKTTRVFKSLPKSIIFDRGPSSIEKLSARYTGGSILLPLARLTDWDINLGKEITNFIQNCKEKAPSITIVNTLQDHRFHGDVNLCASPEIKKLSDEKKVTTIMLDICQQAAHESAHHCLNLGKWYASHIVEGYVDQNFLQPGQRLSDAIINQSLASKKTMPRKSRVDFFDIGYDMR